MKKWIEVTVPRQVFKFPISDEEYVEYERIKELEWDDAMDFYLSDVNPEMSVSLETDD